MRAVRPRRDGSVCVPEKPPLILCALYSECASSRCAGVSAGPHSPIQMCPGAGCGACLLLRIRLDPPRRSSGQTHVHILWMFGKNKMWWEGAVFFKRFFCFSISSCVNVSLLCSCTLRQSQPLKRVSVQKNTCFESLFRFRNHTSVSLRWLELYPRTSCPASA